MFLEIQEPVSVASTYSAPTYSALSDLRKPAKKIDKYLICFSTALRTANEYTKQAHDRAEMA